MRKSHKERIAEALGASQAAAGRTTEELVSELGIRRNLVSRYLNELVAEGQAVKTKTRPVVYRVYEQGAAANVSLASATVLPDVFGQLVGGRGSLREAVEQCQAAVCYPGRDMSVLLTGDSGVGKSYLASLVHAYAEQTGHIAVGAPFVVYNCADYADNPELLSANLFGYAKGSFTGADKEHLGALELADGGYLFLDEVHRLSAEGQEKLFVFMDKGVFKRLGESKAERRAAVRLIFATTEDPQTALLDTFRRRIPLVVHLPRLDERPVDERITMLYKFFRQEAHHLHKDMAVHKQVVNRILSQKNSGNIGSLKNTVRLCCALAYKEQQDTARLMITKRYLPLAAGERQQVRTYYYEEYLEVQLTADEPDECRLISHDRCRRLDEMVEAVDELLSEFQQRRLPSATLRQQLTQELNRSLEILVYEQDDELGSELVNGMYQETVEQMLKNVEHKYGIRYYGNTSKLLTRMLLFHKNVLLSLGQEESQAGTARIRTVAKQELSKPWVITDYMIRQLENSLDCSLDNRIQVTIFLYVMTMMHTAAAAVNALIVAHGYSTASSIASVANQLYGQFVFEAFDMPMDTSPIVVKEKIRDYLRLMDSSQGTVILVDMGSLLDIHTDLADCVAGDLAIINNITTNIALDIAEKIINGQRVEAMLHGLEQRNPLICRYIKAKNKKKAILTTCISGIGTAQKVKNLLRECIGDAAVEIMACDYASLTLKGSEDSVFQEYDVKLIISTTKLEIPDVPAILVHDLINGACDELLLGVLQAVEVQRSLEAIKQDIAKMFSLDNLIARMTILNPRKIINQVETMLLSYETLLGKRFGVDLKMILYMHVSVLIERLMLKQGLEFAAEEAAAYQAAEPRFIAVSQEVFTPVCSEYQLAVPLKEIHIIQNIIESRLGRLTLP